AGTHPPAPGRPWVVAAPQAITTREVVRSICRALKKPEPRLSVPLAPLQLTAVAMQDVLPRLGLRPPLHRRRLDFFVKSSHVVSDEIRSVLGLGAVGEFDEGPFQGALWDGQRSLL